MSLSFLDKQHKSLVLKEHISLDNYSHTIFHKNKNILTDNTTQKDITVYSTKKIKLAPLKELSEIISRTRKLPIDEVRKELEELFDSTQCNSPLEKMKDLRDTLFKFGFQGIKNDKILLIYNHKEYIIY